MRKLRGNSKNKFIYRTGILLSIILIFNFVWTNSYGVKVKGVERYIASEGIDNSIHNIKSESKEIQTFELPVIIRDFKADYIFFEQIMDLVDWGRLGNVGLKGSALGEDKKPIFSEDYITYKVESLLKENKKGEIVLNIIEADLKKPNKEEELATIQRLKSEAGQWNKGEYIETQSWYETIKNEPYNDEVKEDIDTVYKYVYYMTNKFFNDTEGLNIQDENVVKSIPLTKDINGDKYSFDSDVAAEYKEKGGFFPLDGEGFENQGNTHNYHFSLESHSKFYVQRGKTLEFTFKGDDDVWVYIDNKLVIDLGGIHAQYNGEFKIEPNPDNINESIILSKEYNDSNKPIIENGKNKYVEVARIAADRWYDFDFFYMERHTSQSNLKIETNIDFESKISVDKIAYIVNEAGDEIELDENAVVYPGQTVYYKFRMNNIGNTVLKNLTFTDDLLGIEITPKGVTKDGLSIGYDDIEVRKIEGDSDQVEIGKLELLEKLQPNGVIEVKSREFINLLITEEHLLTNDAKVTNTLVVKAIASEPDGEKEYTDQATVTVGDLKEEFVKLDIVKSVDSIKRNDEIIYESKDSTNLPSIEPNNMPQIKPEDIVRFKFDIKNNSAITTNDDLGNEIIVPIPINDIKLNDVLEIGKNNNVRDAWTFLDSEDNKIIDGIGIPKSTTINIYTDWIVGYDEANHYEHTWERDVTNTVTISKTIKEDGKDVVITNSSEVKLKIQPVGLKIKKNIVDESSEVNNELDPNRTFTIKVKGSNGDEYIVEALPGEVYFLDNLRYGTKDSGIRYAISETVPMNYELVGIDNENVALEAKQGNERDDELSTIYNKKVNESYFTDEVMVTNKFNNYQPKEKGVK